MGICSNCISRGDIKSDCRRNPHLRKEDFICLNENNAEIDFVTGEAKSGSCRNKNNFGECLFYEPLIPYESLSLAEDYLFTANYEVLDYDYAAKYFKENYPAVGGCSTVRKGNYMLRHYDWLYNEQATFRINVFHKGDTYASHGIASLKGLDKDFVNSVIESTEDKDLSLFKILPFFMLDGENEFGVTASINVVPQDKGKTSGTVPLVREKDRINVFMLIRYVLDRFSSAKKAVRYLRDYVSIYVPETEKFHYECHFIIADKDESYLVEFINNELKFTLMEKSYITNFHLEGVLIDEETSHVDISTVEPFGMGIERYNIIADAFENLEDIDDFRNLREQLLYTKAYTETENPWYTEFTGDYSDSGHGILTVQSDPSEFDWILNHERERFTERSRDPDSENYGTWQTVHAVIYDIPNRTLHVTSQENSKEFTFSLDM